MVMTRSARDPDAIYAEHIASLSDAAKQRLLTLIGASMARRVTPRRVRLIELSGLGQEVWEGVDPDAYVNVLRDEWDDA